MASNVIGSVAVLIRPVIKGFNKAIKDAYNDAYKQAASEHETNPADESTDGYEEAGKKSGNRFSQSFVKWAKRGLMVGVAAVGAAVGATFIGAFQSAVTQQQGQKVLSGLYGDAAKAASTIQGLKKVSKNSPIEYASYQSAAESLAYAGAEGDEAIGVLDNMGKAITAAGGDSTNLDSATDAILKGVNAGKFQLDTLQQLSDSGIPILSGLADHFGVSIEEVNSMASAGKISLEDVMSVLQNAEGDTFQQMIKAGDAASTSFGNQWKIAKDNIQVALGGVLMPLIEAITPAIQPMANTVVGFIERIPSLATNIAGVFQSVWGVLKPIAPIIGAIVGAMLLWNTTTKISTALFAAQKFIQAGWISLTGLQIGLTNLWTLAQKGLNGAMRANPIGLLVTALMLLVAGFIVAYKNSETFRNIVNAAWAGIKAAALAVVGWFQTTAWPVLQTIFSAIGTAAVWLWQNALLPAWNGIRFAIGAVVTWLTGTAWPAIQAAWNAIAFAATWLWQSVLVPAWNGIRFAIATVATWITGTLVPALSAAWQAVGAAASWLYRSVILPVWTGIKVAIALVVAAVMTYMDMWAAIFRTVVAPVFRWLYNSVILPVWRAIRGAISSVVTWFKGTAVPVIRTAIAIAQAAFAAFKAKLLAIWRAVRVNVIQPVLSWFKTTVVAGFTLALATVKAKFQSMKDKLAALWRAVKQAVIQPVYSWFKNTVVAGFTSALATVKAKFQSMKDKLATLWRAVRANVIEPVYSWFKKTVVAGFTTALGTVKAKFGAMKTRLSEIWKSVKNSAIKPVYDWFKNTVVGGLKSAADKISDAFSTMKDGVGKAWDKVKAKAKAPIRFVVDTVINKGIVKNFNKIAGKFGVKKLPNVSAGFASGGVLPGYTPGRDVHSFYSPALGRLDLSGGEAIMRPEFTRAVGGAAGVARLNKAAMNRASISDAFASGGVWGGPRQAYKGGGVLSWIKDKTSKAASWIKDKASWVKDVLSDPLGSFKTLAKGLLSSVPAAGLMSDLGKGVVTNVASGIGNFLKGKNDTANTSGGGVPAGTGKGGSLAWADRVARKHGLTMTSGYRPGARTSSGSLSMHGLGRAHDYSNGISTRQERAFFLDILRNSKPIELLHTPMGALNVHRGGRQYPNSGTVARIHYNHVHVAYKKGGVLGDLAGGGSPLGGIVPTLYDSGGIIPPGLSVIANQTRKPEAALTNEQTRAIQALADGRAGGGGPTYINHVTAQQSTARELVDELSWQQRIQTSRRGRYANAGR